MERWLFDRVAASFDEMTDLPAPLRTSLAASYFISAPTIQDERCDVDGTIKYLFAFRDGARAEAVFLPGGGYDAACLSTQAGCAFGCRFCATGAVKFQRNLTAYEMFISYAILVKRQRGRRPRNVLFMGQGEPFANVAALRGAVTFLQTHAGVGGRKITVSTVGFPDKIVAWAESGPPVELAVSLHSAVQETRDELMPKLARYPLAALRDACRFYGRQTRRPLTLEYVLAGGVNDNAAHARALVAFARGLNCKINVIPFNRWPGAPYRAPTRDEINKFMAKAAGGRQTVTLRKPRGTGIGAACGMLANRTAEGDA